MHDRLFDALGNYAQSLSLIKGKKVSKMGLLFKKKWLVFNLNDYFPHKTLSLFSVFFRLSGIVHFMKSAKNVILNLEFLA